MSRPLATTDRTHFKMFDEPPLIADRQKLRSVRMLLGSATYGSGLLLLAMCALLDMFPWRGLSVLAVIFVAINVGFHSVIASGLNLRLADPSMTRLQIYVGPVVIAIILGFGAQIHFMAVPFYCVLFVFAMLRLSLRELIAFETFLLATYACALLVRHMLYGDLLDMRVEVILAVLIVVSSLWFTLAAAYISRLRARLADSLRVISQQAARDGLTGVWNRRALDALLAAEMGRHGRSAEPLCACMLDVDHFKSVNDEFGHLEGDAVLRKVTASVQSQLRANDQLGRFGGEEFLVLLPATPLAHALGCAERLRKCVASLQTGLPADRTLTVSMGLAVWTPGESAERFIGRVDAALYRAKRDGRNRVVVDQSAGVPASV